MVDTTPTSLPARRAYRIGAWLLQPDVHSLRREDVEHRVPKRLVMLLQTLAEHAGETLSREALLDIVWQRKVINDEVLSRAIAELRGLLGDDARSPAYIETLPKTGYRLIAPVSVVAAESAPVPKSEAQRDAEVELGTPTPEGERPAESAGADRVAARSPSAWSPPGYPWLWGVGTVVVLLAVAWLLAGRDVSRPEVPPKEAAEQSDWSPARMVREQPFRSGPDWARQPRFSRDGRWLTYVVGVPGELKTSIILSAADGSSAREIEAGPGRIESPVFSPDGTRMAVVARVDRDCVIRIIDLPAAAPRELASCAPQVGVSLEWHAPQNLLYTAPAAPGRGSGIWSVDPDTGASMQRTDPALEDIYDTMPRARRDGGFAFLRGPFRLQKVWQWRDGAASVLFDSADRVTGMAWTLDEARLLLSTDRSGFPALHVFDLASRTSSLLGGRGAATLDRAPDDSLLYEQRRYDANIWRYQSGEAPQRITLSTRYDAYPELSPDGRRLVYVSNRDGTGSVWVVDLASGNEQRLDLPEDLVWVRPAWLDDRHIALTRYDAEHATALLAFDLVAQRLQRHALAHGSGFSVAMTADHGLVFGFDHGAGEGMQLVLRDREGDQAVAGARAVGEFRADGNVIAWQQRGLPGIRVRDLDAGDSEYVIPPHDADSDYFAWTIVGGWLIYAHADDAGWALWRRRMPEGGPERWMDLLGTPSDAQITVSRTLDSAMISHIDEFHADLMRVPPP